MKANWRREKIHKTTIFTFLNYFVKDHFPQFSVDFNEEKIWIRGKLTDCDWKNEYEFLITTNLTANPITIILNPEINPKPEIHMYSNKSLCLYWPKDLPIDYNFKIVTDIIPWLIKWVHYFEIWLRNGNHWLGPEAPHT